MKTIELNEQNYDVNISSDLKICRSVFNPLIGGEISIMEFDLDQLKSDAMDLPPAAPLKDISSSH